jgi:crotonobetainyl-CoA:carnitine CoA-transferase CaiB-like acyl-CoA transferase
VPCEFATRLVVDAGIAVVKVETTDGDPLRAQPGHLFSYLAAGKQSVAVAEQDLTSTLALLLDQSDAVVCDEWGRDVVADIPRSTPMVVVGERDTTALQGMLRERSDEFLAFHGAGLGFITPRVMPGYPSHDPLCPQAHLVEFLSGLYGAIAVFALLARSADASAAATVGIAAAALPLLRREVAAVLYDGAKPHRSERIWKVSPAEVHRCHDGWVFVDVIEDMQWVRLCEYMGRPDLAADAQYATRDQRFARAEVLCEILDAFFATRSKSCWIDAQARGVPVAPVNTLEDLLHDRQLEARGFWTRIAAADRTTLVAPSSPLARIFRGDAGAPVLRTPALGEHSAEILRTLAAA